MGLLDVANVVRSDGPWTIGYDLEESGCGLAVRVSPVCTPISETVVGDPNGDPQVLKIEAFSVEAVLRRQVRCALDQDVRRVDAALEGGQELAIAHVFEVGANSGGTWNSPYLGHSEVSTVTKGATPAESLLAVLAAFYRAAPTIPILHLGLKAAASSLTDSMVATLAAIEVPVVVSPGYSSDLIAATGPVTIRIGKSETLQSYSVSENQTDILATELAAVEFDVCQAFRVSPT